MECLQYAFHLSPEDPVKCCLEPIGRYALSDIDSVLENRPGNILPRGRRVHAVQILAADFHSCFVKKHCGLTRLQRNYRIEMGLLQEK